MILGDNVLHIAALKGHHKIAELFIDSGVSLHEKNNNGK